MFSGGALWYDDSSRTTDEEMGDLVTRVARR
jgi:hypothetical protein